MLKQFFLHNSNKYEIYQGNQTLGRSFKNAISIEDASISKYHLLISSFDDYTEIIDLNTSNGTSINNTRLQPYEATKLNKGDKIRVGWVLIEYGTDYVDEKLLLGKSNFETVKLSYLYKTPDNISVFEKYNPRKFFSESSYGGNSLEQLQENNKILSFLYNFNQKIDTITTLDEFLEYIVKQIIFIFPSTEKAILIMYENNKIKPRYFWKNGKEQSINNLIYSNNLFNMVIKEKHGFITSEDKENYSVTAPIMFEEEVLGVIEISNKKDTNTFNEKDLKILCSICNQLASKIKAKFLKNKSHLQTRTLKINNEKLLATNKILENRVSIMEEELNKKNILLDEIDETVSILRKEKENLKLELERLKLKIPQKENKNTTNKVISEISYEIGNNLDSTSNYSDVSISLLEKLLEDLNNYDLDSDTRGSLKDLKYFTEKINSTIRVSNALIRRHTISIRKSFL